MTEQPTSDRPTDQLMNYYSFRITVPHVDYPKIQEIFLEFSKNFLAAGHHADPPGTPKGVPHEHWHVLFLDFSPNKADTMKRALRRVFSRSGNEFYAGKFMDNHVYKGIQYCKHDPNVIWKHRGSHWAEYIAESPDFDHTLRRKETEPTVKKRAREADPMLTYSNVLWRARAHRTEHNIKSTDLGVVLEHMTRTTNWIPSVELMRKGLDPLHHRLFEYQTSGKVGKTPDWWTPRFN